MKKMNRRSFIKLSTVAMAAASGTVYTSKAKWTEAASKTPPSITRSFSVCNSCGNRCNIIAFKRQGRLWRISGNPRDNKTGGKICARGHAYAAMVYDRYRLGTPLKRTPSGFEPISWEQAYEEISDKLKDILRKNGPEAIFWSEYSKPISNFYGARFMAALGSPNWTTHASTCFAARNVGFNHTLGGLPTGDYENTKYVVFIGRAPADGIGTSILKGLPMAKQKGAKVVAVDPRLSYSANSLANEWMAIKPGTDLALLLAWIHTMIKENLYDREFVSKHTVGFSDLEAAVEPYTPAWAAGVTGLPEEQISRVAKEMAAAKPAAFIEPGWHAAYGSNYRNSTQTARAIAIINALLGNLNKPGGLCFYSGANLGSLDSSRHQAPPNSPYKRVDGAGVAGKYPLALGSGLHHLLPGLAKEGKFKAGFFYSINPARTVPDREYVVSGYKNLELSVVIDWQFSETAEHVADYILPESHPLERDGIVEPISARMPQVSMQSKAIEPVHPGARGLDRIVTELAQAMGFGRYFDFTLDDLNKAMLFPLKLFPVHLQQRGPQVAGGAWDYGQTMFRTPSGKVELASGTFAEHGFSKVPIWESPLIEPSSGEFRIIHGHQAYLTHSQTINNPYLVSIAKDYHGEAIWINSKKARELGIADGSDVIVSAKGYENKVRCKVTERIHPEAIFVPAGYGSFASKLERGFELGISMNDFVPHASEDISGHAMMQEAVVSIRKA